MQIRLLLRKKCHQLIEQICCTPGSTGIRNYMGQAYRKRAFSRRFSIQNVRDIHLTTGINGGFDAGGDIKYVYIFILIAVFIILLACINFTNLSTARSTSRLKEVGIRKVFGVQRSKLITSIYAGIIFYSFCSIYYCNGPYRDIPSIF